MLAKGQSAIQSSLPKKDLANLETELGDYKWTHEESWKKYKKATDTLVATVQGMGLNGGL